MRIKKKKKILLTNYHNKLFRMEDKEFEILFNEWEELEIENDNCKKKEAINIFLVFIYCMVENNADKNIDVNSLD